MQFAEMTYAYHCCAFEFPEKQKGYDSNIHRHYEEFKEKISDECTEPPVRSEVISSRKKYDRSNILILKPLKKHVLVFFLTNKDFHHISYLKNSKSTGLTMFSEFSLCAIAYLFSVYFIVRDHRHPFGWTIWRIPWWSIWSGSPPPVIRGSQGILA